MVVIVQCHQEDYSNRWPGGVQLKCVSKDLQNFSSGLEIAQHSVVNKSNFLLKLLRLFCRAMIDCFKLGATGWKIEITHYSGWLKFFPSFDDIYVGFGLSFHLIWTQTLPPLPRWLRIFEANGSFELLMFVKRQRKRQSLVLFVHNRRLCFSC